MSCFSPSQVKALAGKLKRSHIRTRTAEGGRDLSYLEGWFVVSEANAIFGFGGWDRETVQFERVFERNGADGTSCAYLARIRLKVRAGDGAVAREGTGFGSASSAFRADAHEKAIKAAETDATKRALATFGNRFGLCLYDKEQAGVEEEAAASEHWTVFDPDGKPFIEALRPESFCSALRQIVEQRPKEELKEWRKTNAQGLERLRRVRPDIRSAKGSHYVDILLNLLDKRIDAISENSEIALPSASSRGPLAPSKIAPGLRIDKSELLIKTERRVRDKAHLKYVALQPCLVCGRLPSHAHHLTFAQIRGLSQKVSDEFTVPLCALHHGELHHSINEREWWEKHGVEPLPIADALWKKSRSAATAHIEQPNVTLPSHAERPSDAAI